MSGSIQQLLTPNCPVAQLIEHRTEDLLVWVRIQGVLRKNCLNFYKMNGCPYLAEPIVVIPLFPNVISILVST